MIENATITMEPGKDPHDKIFDIIFKEDEVTWQSILFELVKSEQMDPWDINVTLITKKYIDMLNKLKESNFRMSGKVLLAAVLLLKIKSKKLIGEDIENLDKLFTSEDDDIIYDEEMITDLKDEVVKQEEKPILIPKTPQPRKRKVSIYDLVDALQQALEVKHRRVLQSIPAREFDIPKKSVDMSNMIKQIYMRIKKYFATGNKNLTFQKLVPSDVKEDKVYAFIPLLHLTNNRKVDLYQEEHFGDIEITLLTKQNITLAPEKQ